MSKIIEVKLTPEEVASGLLTVKVAEKLGVLVQELPHLVIVKRSLDARSRHPFYFYQVSMSTGEPELVKDPLHFQNVKDARGVLVVGAGPAGLFAALELIHRGLKPVIIERGKSVRERRRDLAQIGRQGKVNTESNYCFGEGGAGTYSDGKLYTRSGNVEAIKKVLALLVHFGATPAINFEARPHIGTNLLPQIITAIKERITECGGEIHFSTRMEGIHCSFGKFESILDQHGKTWKADSLVLAAGHSARNIFDILFKNGIYIQAKGLAVGVRAEHPQELINQIQYKSNSYSSLLPPAYYQLTENVANRGVYSFCMCPGGIIAPCATDSDEVVVNGWSPSKRNNDFANSGIVVQVEPADIFGNDNHPLKMLDFQRKLEKAAFLAGGGNLQAPAQRMVDFAQGKLSKDLPKTSYHLGIKSAQMDEIFPDEINRLLRAALPKFGSKMRGYLSNEAVLIGVESRSSSPVRIPRNPVTLEHTQIESLYPCGEGAGYAGGIMSAAIDGMLVADAISKR